MNSVLLAESAVLRELNTACLSLLVLCCIVISLLALCACQHDLISHVLYLPLNF